MPFHYTEWSILGMSVPLPVVICDDSKLARKQMCKALSAWNIEITEVEDGLKALEAIRQGQGHLLFLDLNMPIMDGYEVLEQIRKQDLQTLVIVVSGDVQSEAQRRVLELGALGFISKPIDAPALRNFLAQYGLLDDLQEKSTPTPAVSDSLKFHDCYRELANIAMGRAADLLSQLLGAFIQLPIPEVSMIDAKQLNQRLHSEYSTQTPTGLSNVLCQGFLGPAISGEALLIFNHHSFEDTARLLQYEGALTQAVQRELLMDIANVLISAFLGSLGHQLDVDLNQGAPIILDPPADNQLVILQQWRESLSIELNYQIEGYDIACTLMILFTQDSLSALNDRVRHLL